MKRLAPVFAVAGMLCTSSPALEKIVDTAQVVQQSQYAVLVSDMQIGMLQESVFPEELESEIGHQVELLEAAREKGVPIALIRWEGYGPVDPRIAAAAGPGAKEFVKKAGLPHPPRDAFAYTDVAEFLYSHGVDRTVIMGAYAVGCTSATFQGARNSGFLPETSPELTIRYFFGSGDEGEALYRAHGIYRPYDELPFVRRFVTSRTPRSPDF